MLIGLFTRLAAFVLSGEMGVGYFLSHAPRSFFPVLNRGDAAVPYCFVFLHIFVAGPEVWSLDHTSGPLLPAGIRESLVLNRQP